MRLVESLIGTAGIVNRSCVPHRHVTMTFAPAFVSAGGLGFIFV